MSNTMSYKPRGMTRRSTEVMNPPRSNLNYYTKEFVAILAHEAISTYQPMSFLTTSRLHFTTINGDIKESIAPKLNKIERGVPLITLLVSPIVP
jgi:hypothetical protein